MGLTVIEIRKSFEWVILERFLSTQILIIFSELSGNILSDEVADPCNTED